MKNNWQTKKLGDIFQIERGGSPRPIESFLTTDDDGINWIKIGDTKGVTKYIYKTEQKIKPSGLKKTRLVHDGDFILSNSMSFGRPYIMKTTGAIHDGWLVMKEKLSGIDRDFFYYLLSSPVVFNQFDNLASGSTVRNLNTKLVSSVEVSFPPLNEQKEVVRILDNIFLNVAKVKDNAEKNLRYSKDLFESHLQSIFTSHVDNWKYERLGDVCSTGAGGTPLKSHKDYYDGGSVPWLRSGEVDKKEILTSELFITEKGVTNSSARLFPKDTVLVAMYGATAGQVGILRFESTTNQAVSGILPNNNFLPEFIYYVFSAKKQELVDQAVGGAQSNISQIKIKNTIIPVPTLSEQREIVKKLDALSEQTKKLEGVYKQKIADFEELKKSILCKTFASEL